METTNEQELNKKLAEWAAIKVEHFNNDKHRHYHFCGEYDVWHEDEPNFIQSLDACFKWLVPKLRELYTLQHIDYDMIRNQVLVWFWIRHRPENPDEFTAEWGINSNPALALCLAIEKLIDK